MNNTNFTVTVPDFGLQDVGEVQDAFADALDQYILQRVAFWRSANVRALTDYGSRGLPEVEAARRSDGTMVAAVGAEVLVLAPFLRRAHQHSGERGVITRVVTEEGGPVKRGWPEAVPSFDWVRVDFENGYGWYLMGELDQPGAGKEP